MLYWCFVLKDLTCLFVKFRKILILAENSELFNSLLCIYNSNLNTCLLEMAIHSPFEEIYKLGKRVARNMFRKWGYKTWLKQYLFLCIVPIWPFAQIQLVLCNSKPNLTRMVIWWPTFNKLSNNCNKHKLYQARISCFINTRKT